MRDFNGTKPSRLMRYYARKSFRFKIMPFTYVRFFGKYFSWRFLKNHIKTYYKVETEAQRSIIIDYQYHIFLQKPSTELSLLIMFNHDFQALIPLCNFDKLGNPNFTIPFSFIYAQKDYAYVLDDGTS